MRGRTGTRNSARLLPRPVWAREQDAARGSGREVALLHYSGYRVASQATATKAAVAHAAAVAVDRRQHAAAGLEQAVRHLNLERPRNTPSSDFQHWICPPKLQSSNGMQFSARLGWQKCMRSAPRRPVREAVPSMAPTTAARSRYTPLHTSSSRDEAPPRARDPVRHLRLRGGRLRMPCVRPMRAEL